MPYHISADGNVRKCRAKTPSSCKVKSELTIREHFKEEGQARLSYEKFMKVYSKNQDILSSINDKKLMNDSAKEINKLQKILDAIQENQQLMYKPQIEEIKQKLDMVPEEYRNRNSEVYHHTQQKYLTVQENFAKIELIDANIAKNKLFQKDETAEIQARIDAIEAEKEKLYNERNEHYTEQQRKEEKAIRTQRSIVSRVNRNRKDLLYVDEMQNQDTIITDMKMKEKAMSHYENLNSTLLSFANNKDFEKYLPYYRLASLTIEKEITTYDVKNLQQQAYAYESDASDEKRIETIEENIYNKEDRLAKINELLEKNSVDKISKKDLFLDNNDKPLYSSAFRNAPLTKGIFQKNDEGQGVVTFTCHYCRISVSETNMSTLGTEMKGAFCSVCKNANRINI